MKKRCMAIALLTTFLAHSQTNLEMPNIIHPSPNAQTFLKYGNYPVSNYTGIPDIRIPIYTIKLKDISVPVTISYNASGIRVEEEASRIGLGWLLNAGGVITHTIMGRYNDFYQGVYFNSYPENKLADLNGIYTFSKYTLSSYSSPLPFTLSNMSKKDFYNGLSNDGLACGGVELAPDVFNYDFMGYSGKFIFSRSGEIIKEKEDNLIISPVKIENVYGIEELQSWVITTPDGTKYYFNQTEQSQIPNKPIDRAYYYSSFYLTSIETINGTIINLRYKKNGTILGTFNKIQDSRLDNDISIDYVTYEIVYLNEITYPGGALRFEYKFDREDYKPEPRLSTIYIDEAGVNKSMWHFEQGYFTANAVGKEIPTLERIKNLIQNKVSYYDESWNNKRLKLQEIKHISNNGTYSYKFSYNEINLPTKLSTSIDHWGYYNGANNDNLIPSYLQNISQQSGKIELGGGGLKANREPSESHNQAFILNKITYPTGGETKFIYETNKYKTDDFENDPYKRDFYYSKQIIRLEESVGWNNVPIDYEHTVPLKLLYTTETGYRTLINVKIKITVNDSYNGSPGEKALYMSIEDNTYKPWSFTYQAPYLPSVVNNSNRTYERVWNNVESYIGDYKLKIYGSLRNYIQYVELEVSRIVCPTEYLSNNPIGLGGGLRIKEIKSSDIDGKMTSDKKYVYTSDGLTNEVKTSGKLMFYPRYAKNAISTGSNGLRGGGYSVGYSQVYVSDIDQSGNELGKTIYSYINKPDKNLYYTWEEKLPNSSYSGLKAKDENPSGIGGYKYSENGTLIKETILKIQNGAFLKVKETEFSYEMLGDGPHIIWGVLKSYLIPEGATNCYDDYAPGYLESIEPTDKAYGYLYPAIRPYLVKVKQKKETIYENDASSETIIKYDYNSKYHYVIKKTVQSQNQDLKIIEYIYPPDLETDSIMISLTKANRISLPVEIKQTIKNSSAYIINDYALFNNKPELSLIKSNTGINKSIEPRIKYHNYDIYGNPIYISKDSITQIVFLWGYSGQYPVAEIINATYNQVKATLGAAPESLSSELSPNESLIEGLRAKLKGAHITTYTYKPLVGMISMTNSKGEKFTYEYDDFGRLICIKDHAGKVLENYIYHYK